VDVKRSLQYTSNLTNCNLTKRVLHIRIRLGVNGSNQKSTRMTGILNYNLTGHVYAKNSSCNSKVDDSEQYRGSCIYSYSYC
jgi:hypothetical protein